MSFQCPLVTSGTSAMNMPSPGFVPGKVLTTPQGFRSIKSGTLTDVGSTKIRLFSAACTLSILERSNQVDISCIGSSRSYKDWLYVLCWSLYRPPKATGNCLPYGLSWNLMMASSSKTVMQTHSCSICGMPTSYPFSRTHASSTIRVSSNVK